MSPVFSEASEPPLVRLGRVSAFCVRDGLPVHGSVFLFFIGALGLAAVAPLGAIISPTWHAQEAVFGVCAALLGGFLLIALPNWTGLPPTRVPMIYGLLGLWTTGRVLVASGTPVVWPILLAVDAIYWLTLAGYTLLMTRASGRVRLWKIAFLVCALAVTRLAFSVEVTLLYSSEVTIRVGASLVTLLCMALLGRMIPVFTEQLLARQMHGVAIPGFDVLDRFAITVSVLTLVTWIWYPSLLMTGILSILAAGLNFLRWGRWRFYQISWLSAEAGLHVAFFFMPIGFVLLAISSLWPGIVSGVTVIHAFMGGTMLLAALTIITRFVENHLGIHMLGGPVLCRVLALSVGLASSIRLLADISGPHRNVPLIVSGIVWFAALTIFLIVGLLVPLMRSHRR